MSKFSCTDLQSVLFFFVVQSYIEGNSFSSFQMFENCDILVHIIHHVYVYLH